MDRRQMTFAQTQTKKPKSKKLRVLKLSKKRNPGTTAAAKRKKLNRVNKTFMQLESDCKNLIMIGVRNRREIARLNRLLETHLSSNKAREKCIKSYNEGLSAYAWWKDGVQYVGNVPEVPLKDALR